VPRPFLTAILQDGGNQGPGGEWLSTVPSSKGAAKAFCRTADSGKKFDFLKEVWAPTGWSCLDLPAALVLEMEHFLETDDMSPEAGGLADAEL